MSLRLKKRGDKALERALVNASPDDPSEALGCSSNSIPGPSHYYHRREAAEGGP